MFDAMKATDIFLQALKTDGVQPPMQMLKRKLFDAIKKGDLEKVESALNHSPPKCGLNSVNEAGKTVLQVAADLEDVSVRNAMIKFLLGGGADLELALLHAVREGNETSVEILLEYREPSSPQPGTPFIVSNSKRERYITPLIFAACLENFRIMKLLLDHGFTICDSQSTSYQLQEVVSEKLGPAVYRLNLYRALASPVYISASFLQNSLSDPHPVYRACVLKKMLCGMAEQDYEFRKEYLELSDGCKEFAVAILNECRSMEEIRCVLEMQNGQRILPRTDGGFLNILEFAIATRNEKFVSHPYSQLVLNSKIYRDVAFLEKSAWKQFAFILFSFVVFPLLLMVWLVFDNCLPNHDVGRMLHSPCVKFLIHCGSYQTFLFVLFLSSFTFQSAFLKYAFTDWIILFFVIGHLVDLVKQIYHKGRVRFFSNYWSYLNVATVTLFLLHYAFWWAGRAVLIGKLDSMTWENHAEDRSYTIVLVSDCLLSVAILLAFAQNLSFIQVSPTIGPLLHAFTRMLLDVMKFFFYFIFVFLAFVVSFTKLYLQYAKAKKHFLSGKMGNNETDSLHLQSMLGSVSTIFWSLFGQIDPDSFQIAEEEYTGIWKTGVALFGVFNIVAVLVALNMLIAILNDSYVQITANLDAEWKLTRTKLWLSWVNREGVLPPPFNILYLLLPFLWVIKRLAEACCAKRVLLILTRFNKMMPSLSWKSKRISEKERREVIRRLILRNLAKKAYLSENETESKNSEDENENEATIPLPFEESVWDSSL